jgi:hypothetical protein
MSSIPESRIIDGKVSFSFFLAMQKKSQKYVCCHEAGHAVVAHLNGYKIREVRISFWSDAPFSEPAGESYVLYEPESWTCEACSSHIANRHDAELLATLADSCPTCKEEKFRFIERCLAGPVSTESLEPCEHDVRDGEFDRAQVGQIYPTRSEGREQAFALGFDRVRVRIRDVADVICMLRDELLRNGMRMSGEEARRFITAALASHEKGEATDE